MGLISDSDRESAQNLRENFHRFYLRSLMTAPAEGDYINLGYTCAQYIIDGKANMLEFARRSWVKQYRISMAQSANLIRTGFDTLFYRWQTICDEMDSSDLPSYLARLHSCIAAIRSYNISLYHQSYAKWVKLINKHGYDTDSLATAVRHWKQEQLDCR